MDFGGFQVDIVVFLAFLVEFGVFLVEFGVVWWMSGRFCGSGVFLGISGGILGLLVT